jgi:putative ABC transport system substrate-binding protein
MKRREFIAIAGGAAAWPLAVRAQQPARLPLVAILRSEVAGDPEALRNSGALIQGLQALGWTQDRNVRIEQRWAGGSVDAMKVLAKELVALQPLSSSFRPPSVRQSCKRRTQYPSFLFKISIQSAPA